MSLRAPAAAGKQTEVLEKELQTLQLALIDEGLDAESTEIADELRGYAALLAIMKVCAVRPSKQNLPDFMLDSIPDWEDVLQLQPMENDSVVDRRSAIQQVFRILIGNDLGDLEDAAVRALGRHFDELILVSEADQWSYLPGVNPGPPGMEFASSRACLGVRMKTHGLASPALLNMRARVRELFRRAMPDYQRMEVGIGEQFLAGESLVGLSFIS